VGFNKGLAVGESDKEVLAMENLVGFNEGLSVGESDDEVLSVGELVGFDEERGARMRSEISGLQCVC
jgi:hypothetical protein